MSSWEGREASSFLNSWGILYTFYPCTIGPKQAGWQFSNRLSLSASPISTLLSRLQFGPHVEVASVTVWPHWLFTEVNVEAATVLAQVPFCSSYRKYTSFFTSLGRLWDLKKTYCSLIVLFHSASRFWLTYRLSATVPAPTGLPVSWSHSLYHDGLTLWDHEPQIKCFFCMLPWS